MSRAYLSPQAKQDLLEVWQHIALDSPLAADRFTRRVRELCDDLAALPHMGRSRDDLQHGLRSHPIGKYLVFYRLAPESIEVVRILSGYRDIEGVFESE